MDAGVRAAPDWLARGRAGLGIVLAAYAALVAWALATDAFLNDEGLLTHLFAAITARDFPAAFFLQKTRPPIAALYAPFAAWGFTPFFVAHAVVGAAGILALRATAIASGHKLPNLVAGIVALSPLFHGGAVAGLSNTDAVVGCCVFAWLWAARKQEAVAAIVLGTLVFVRAELGVLVIVVAAFAIATRRWRVLAALPAFGVVYGLAGAAYHGDLLWQFHFPPALPEAMPGNPYWETHSGQAGATDLVGTAVALTPLIPLLTLTSWSRLTTIERIGIAFVVAFTAALVLLPMWRVFNFDQTPRYLLPVLPFVALAAGRVLDGWIEGAPPGRMETLALAAVAGLAFAGALDAPHPTGLAAVGLAALALAAARAGRARVALAIPTALVLVGPFFFADGARIDRLTMAPHLGEMVDRLAELPPAPRRVYTNEPLLAVYLARTGAVPWAEVYFIVQADQRFELERLANPGNGQRDALWAALQHDFYGVPTDADPDEVEPGSIFALRKDERLELALPPAVWDERLTVLHPGYGTVIARFGEAAP
jgi:hypothetical protein